MNGSASGITLIGMPGAGKSTIGVLLSKHLGLDFIDTDLMIQVREQRTLQQILDREGYLGLRAIEESVLLALDPERRVVATGGSVVYSERAMHHLAGASRIVFLDVPLAELRTRIRDYETRGIARRPDQQFPELFAERTILYQRHADLRIDCDRLGMEDVLERILIELATQPRK